MTDDPLASATEGVAEPVVTSEKEEDKVETPSAVEEDSGVPDAVDNPLEKASKPSEAQEAEEQAVPQTATSPVEATPGSTSSVEPQAKKEEQIPPPPSKLQRLRAEYDQLFKPGDYTAVYTKALEGGLRYSKLRALSWKLFLRALPSDVSTWSSSMEKYRQRYKELHNKYYVDPYKDDHLDPNIHNPLSTNQESSWNEYHENTELEKVIQQDLGRTYPEYEFFQSDDVQTMMLHILFIYARENPDCSYRQGMHELLAPFLYVMDREKLQRQAGNGGVVVDASDATSPSDAIDLPLLLDQDFLEADAYELFCRVMHVMKPYFLPTKPQRPVRPAADPLGSTALGGSSPSPRAGVEGEQSAVVKKCHRIHHVLLRKFDSQLYNYLERLKIEPQLYCLRWVRLLLSREFHLEDVLVLWDSIFSEANDFGLVDYVIVAMLVYIRDDILGKDYSMAMRRLFKYPPVEDVHMFVEEALAMRNPGKTFALKTSSGGSLNSPGTQSGKGGSGATGGASGAGGGVKDEPVFELAAMRPIKLFVKQKSSLIGHQSTMLLKEAIGNLEKDIGDLKSLQLQMGNRMEGIVTVLQAELMEGSADYNQNNVLMALAELKQIRDILNDAI